MTKIFRTAAAGAALFAAVGMGSAAHAQDTASADATAEILAALQLQNDDSLDFGAVVMNAGSTGGTVTVDPFGSRSCSGDVICAPGAATEQPAGFTVSGANGPDVIVTVQDLSTTPVSLRHLGFAGSANPEHNIELSGLLDSVGGLISSFTGLESFSVGGEITLDGSEIAGTYEGSFDVSVAYQ